MVALHDKIITVIYMQGFLHYVYLCLRYVAKIRWHSSSYGKYNDKANIVHVYTEQSGRMSFLIPAQRSRKSAVKQVLFQPLSVVEFEADMRPRSGIHPIKEAKAWYVFTSLPYDPYKSAIAMFLAEFLYRALKEETTNVPLFAYLVHSVQWLDVCETSFANFHLSF